MKVSIRFVGMKDPSQYGGRGDRFGQRRFPLRAAGVGRSMQRYEAGALACL